MPRLLMNIRTQPAPLSSGDWIAQTAGDYGDNSLNAGFTVPLSDITIGPDQVNGIIRQTQDGNGRLTPFGRPKRTLRIETYLDEAQLEALDRMLASQRPWAVGAWFDDSTHWMSHFGGGGGESGGTSGVNFSGLGEVGDTDSENISRRSLEDFAPDPFVGDQRPSKRDLTAAGANTPKIVPGMIGGAILLETNRANVATKRVASGSGGIWTATGSNALAQRCLAGSPASPLTGNTEYIQLAHDSGASYVQSASQTVTSGQPYCISVWARGTGQFILGAYQSGTLQVGIGSGELSYQWRRVTLTGYTASASSMTVRMIAESNSGGKPAQFEVWGLQIENGYGPCQSFMNYNVVPSGAAEFDGIYTSDQLHWGGYTFVFWLQWRNDQDRKFLYSVENGGVNHYAEIQGTTITFYYNGANNIATSVTAPAPGTWVQVGITFRSGLTGANKATCAIYFNGALALESQVTAATGLNGTTQNSFYIGCSQGTGPTPQLALMMPLDACRLDERCWTAQEFADDYALRTDTGYKNLMRFIQGRYFRPRVTLSPDSVYVDKMRASIDLVEEVQRRQSVR